MYVKCIKAIFHYALSLLWFYLYSIWIFKRNEEHLGFYFMILQMFLINVMNEMRNIWGSILQMFLINVIFLHVAKVAKPVGENPYWNSLGRFGSCGVCKQYTEMGLSGWRMQVRLYVINSGLYLWPWTRDNKWWVESR